MAKLQLGINHVTNVEYHSDQEWLSSSNLKLLLKDPEQFYQEKILGNRKPTSGSHFDEGSLTHSFILEPHTVDQEFAFYPGLRKQGEEYFKFAEQHSGKTIISRPQKLRVDSYVKAYQKNSSAKELISGGFPEHTICSILSDVPAKIRCDYINVEKGYIVDIKTTAFPADVDSFRLTISQWGYDLSAALYSKIASDHYGKNFDFYFLVIDKKNLVCEVYKASEATLDKGLAQVSEALKLYKQCKKTGLWVKNHPKLELSGDYEILEV